MTLLEMHELRNKLAELDRAVMHVIDRHAARGGFVSDRWSLIHDSDVAARRNFEAAWNRAQKLVDHFQQEELHGISVEGGGR